MTHDTTGSTILMYNNIIIERSPLTSFFSRPRYDSYIFLGLLINLASFIFDLDRDHMTTGLKCKRLKIKGDVIIFQMRKQKNTQMARHCNNNSTTTTCWATVYGKTPNAHDDDDDDEDYDETAISSCKNNMTM
jgi:hypothetical protein